jgi:hypothetical protein
LRSSRYALRILIGITLVLSVVALVLAGIAITKADEDETQLTRAQVVAREFDLVKPRMTSAEVIEILGFPADPSKQCWVYRQSYEIKVCFGPRGRVVAITKNSPSEVVEELLSQTAR